MSAKVFFILDDVVGHVVDAADADEHKSSLRVHGAGLKIETVSKEDYVARGFHYYEEAAAKEFLHDNESIDFSAFDENED